MRIRKKSRAAAIVVSVVIASQGVVALGLGSASASPVPTGTQAPLTTSQAKALSTNVTDKVIVVLKDQLPSTPNSRTAEAQRTSRATTEQAPLVAELSRTAASNVKKYSIINAMSATVSKGEAARLAANPAVAEVVPDVAIPVATSQAAATEAAAEVSSGTTPIAGACAQPGGVQLNPEALETIHAATQTGAGQSAQSLGYTGAGVTAAYIADGIDVNNPDYIRPDGQHVFVDNQDFSNSGTSAPTGGEEAFIDSSSIAAQGTVIYNVSNYSSLPLNRPCDIRIEGVAPGASLVGLNVFGSNAEAFNSVFLEAINYAVTVDHVNVLNESFGSNPFPDTSSLDLTKMANDAAVAAGTTVTVSSGDSGVTNTIGSPATDPAVISVGATTTYRLDVQDGYGGARLPGVTGWLDNNISSLSSGGFTETGSTINVVAPGELNWIPCSTNVKKFEDCFSLAGQPSAFLAGGGTSESAPLTAGVAALVIQAYAEAHHGTDPTPAVVKQIIVSTAEDISSPGDLQGAGQVDAYRAVLAARSYPGGTAAAKGNGLLESALQLNAVGPTSTSETLGETVTNVGSATQTVGLSSRTLAAYKPIATTSVTLSDTSGSHPTDWQGLTDNLEALTFTVPSGTDRLSASIAYQGAMATATDFAGRVRLTLVDPTGHLAAYDVPQGLGNFDNSQVTDPAAGTWTAYIYSRDSADGGTTGKVLFGASVANYVPFGALSASSLTLAPGASGSFKLTVPTPSVPGDGAGSIVLTTPTGPSFTQVTTVPVTLRSLVSTSVPSTTFSGTLTGGNGRSAYTGQTAYYQFNLAAGESVLNADITLADNPDNSFFAELVDPVTSESVSASSNALLSTTPAGQTATPTLGTQLHVVAPHAGLWTLIINFYNQVSGTALSEPFSVTINHIAVPTTATGLPDAATTELAAGKPVTVYVKVKNTGTSPEAYFLDGRLNKTTTLNLPSLTGLSSVVVPIEAGFPEFLVPTHTTSIAASATAAAPIYFDLSWAFGDPDLISTPASDSPTVSFTSPEVAAGEWAITPFQKGPDGKAGLPPVTANLALSATTQAFDPAVSSPSGDLWLEAVDPLAGIDPVVVEPGQTASIPVTITPSGKSGTVVSGTLYVDDAGLFDEGFLAPNASELAALPYTYTIK